MLKRLYEIIEPAENGDNASKAYDLSMMAIIVISLIPLAFKQESVTFVAIDKVCVTIYS